jgi:hypothetical protein
MFLNDARCLVGIAILPGFDDGDVGVSNFNQILKIAPMGLYDEALDQRI